MSIRIEHRIGVAASSERIWEIIADLERWGEWNILNPQATGRIGIGAAIEMIEALEGEAERRMTVQVPDWTPEQQLIWVDRRGWLSKSTRYFEIEKLHGDTSCILANGVIFDGLRGEDWAIKRRGKFRTAFEAINGAIKARAEA